MISERLARVELSLIELSEKGKVMIPLSGNCMWPIVRHGDVVTIENVSYADLKFGDVAIFQTTAETFHANTQFRNLKKEERNLPPKNYVGKITRVKRESDEFNLDKRGGMVRFFQTLLSPANPYGLSLPKTLLRKLKSSSCGL